MFLLARWSLTGLQTSVTGIFHVPTVFSVQEPYWSLYMQGGLMSWPPSPCSLVNCPALSFPISLFKCIFFHSTYWYSKWSYSLRLCLFPLPSLKCKTAWGQRPCFLVHHSITSAKTGSGTKLSDQYKIIYHVNKWTRVIVPDIMSIVIVINVTKYLFNIVSMVNNTVVYSLK